MTWVRGTYLHISGAYAVSIDAILILCFASLTIKHSISRNITVHQRWAMRLFFSRQCGLVFAGVNDGLGNHCAGASWYEQRYVRANQPSYNVRLLFDPAFGIRTLSFGSR